MLVLELSARVPVAVAVLNGGQALDEWPQIWEAPRFRATPIAGVFGRLGL